MYKLERALIVEGKYDKIKLSSLVEGLIIQTDGFGIYNDREKRAMIKKVAQIKGLVILTDSDTAGFKIRHYISSFVPPEKIVNAYIPDIYGKEKRKKKPGKEGKLGVEGVLAEVITEALRKAGAIGEKTENLSALTKADLYELGLSGGEGSAEKRRKVLKALELPEHVSTNGLLQVVNAIMTPEEFKKTVEKI